MFGKAIWDKLPECIFENFETARVNREQFQNFQNSRGRLIQKSPEPKNTEQAENAEATEIEKTF